MPKFSKKITSVCLVAALFIVNLPVSPAKAVVDSCTAIVNPTQVNSGTTQSFGMGVTNGPSATIVWVKITRPNTNFTLTGAVAAGWTRVVTANDATFTGTLAPNGVKNFILTNVQIAPVQEPPADWTVEVSDDINGANPTSCTGTLGTQIGTPDSTPPTINDITVSSITHNSAIVGWTTDEPATSVVNYGVTSSYGNNQSNPSLLNGHSVTLSGLLPETLYHFAVSSADGSGNNTTSSDNTFVTLETPPAPPSQPGGAGSNNSTSAPSNSLSTVPKPPEIPTDTTAPSVSLVTSFDKPFNELPTVLGKAVDDNLVYLIEYSTDNGLNWLPVDSGNGLNKSQVDFSFKPPNLPDDNYSLLVRAFDQNNNEGRSSIVTLIIDKVFPSIGPNVFSYGPQFVSVKENLIKAVQGVDQKITISAIGGPTSVFVRATGNKETKTFTLNKSKEQNLWSGFLAFDKAGTYSLDAFAIDGAKNQTESELSQVLVSESSKILDPEGNPTGNSKVTVYYFDDEGGQWLVWEGSSFGQKNPQNTNSKGEFSFFLPGGKYYLTVESEGFSKFTSDIFTLEDAKSLAVDITLRKNPSLKLLNWKINLPSFSLASQPLKFKEPESSKLATNLEGKLTPDFKLVTTSDLVVETLDLAGKPSVLSFISTWSPESEEQIQALEELATNKEFNVYALVSLESIEKVKSYRKIGDYALEFIVDPTSKTMNDFRITNVPTHVFINRNQTVENYLFGKITKEELQKELLKL